MKAREHWIAYRSKPKGKLVVDEGCQKALMHHTSLLPKGIVDIEGDFLSGAVVDIVNQEGELLAKGITNYASDEVRLIKGVNTDHIEKILHYKDYDTIIHANNMVVLADK